mmetsp:Transcript_88668/g.255697  ORF Transcript_88668/g.255697 Transcript_88668/m.255697 type:complete len:333 (-) Transcript_88668:117-1115(-)
MARMLASRSGGMPFLFVHISLVCGGLLVLRRSNLVAYSVRVWKIPLLPDKRIPLGPDKRIPLVPDKTIPLVPDKWAHPWSEACALYPGKRIVLLSANIQYLDMLKNWLLNAAPHLDPTTEQVMVVAETRQAVPALQNLSTAMGVHFDVYQDPDWKNVENADAHTQYKSKLWASVVTHRPHLILHFLNYGCTVLYQDIDMAWMKPVFPTLDRAGDYDMLLTDDENPPRIEKSNYLCTCFMYIQPTTASKAVVERWGRLARGKDTNQHAFNSALQEFKKRKGIHFLVLPPAQFPCGALFEKSKADALVAHANYLVGLKAKMHFFVKHGLWRVGK